MVAYNKFDIFTFDLVNGNGSFDTNAFKVMLSNTAPTSSNIGATDIVEISAGNGYTAGGPTVSVSSTQTGGVMTATAADVTITASGGSIGPFQYVVFYNDSRIGKPLIGWWDLGSATTIASGDSYILGIPDVTGILQITPGDPPPEPPAGIYVSTLGNDANAGTYASPYATIQKAHDVAVAGDTIYVRGGTYNLTSTIQVTRDGASGNPITLINYPGETPILDGTSVPSGSYTASCAIRLNNALYWTIDGLEVRHCPDFGVKVEGASHGFTFRRNNVHHIGVNASNVDIGSLSEGKGFFCIGSSTDLIVEYNDFHHCTNDTGGNADGLQIATTGVGCTVRYNRSWSNMDDGFDFYMVTYAANQADYIIQGNWAWGNGYQFDGVTPAGDGAGFKLGGARSDSNNGAHQVYQNVAWGNRVYGISSNGNDNALLIMNNTTYNNYDADVGNEYNIYIDSNNHILYNNIHCAPGNLIAASGTNVTNSWQIGGTIDTADFQSVDSTGCDGPRAPDGSLPILTYLRLASGSNMRGAGTDIGDGTDLGAYPYA